MLLVSDAVDQAISQVDFRLLANKKVFLDTQYISILPKTKAITNRDSDINHQDYIISAIRQQMVAAGCVLVGKAAEAEFVAELRVGALGTDQNEVVYGIPASSMLTTVSSLVPTMPQIPTIPEISLAKKDEQAGLAKVSVFVYDQKTGKPFWQSGLAKGKSRSKNLWVFGAGPFQSGTIYDGTQFAGSELEFPLLSRHSDDENEPAVPYDQEYVFRKTPPPASAVQQASAETKADAAKQPDPKAAAKTAAPAKPAAPANPAETTAAKSAPVAKPAPKPAATPAAKPAETKPAETKPAETKATAEAAPKKIEPAADAKPVAEAAKK